MYHSRYNGDYSGVPSDKTLLPTVLPENRITLKKAGDKAQNGDQVPVKTSVVR